MRPGFGRPGQQHLEIVDAELTKYLIKLEALNPYFATWDVLRHLIRRNAMAQEAPRSGPLSGPAESLGP